MSLTVKLSKTYNALSAPNPFDLCTRTTKFKPIGFIDELEIKNEIYRYMFKSPFKAGKFS